MIKKVITIRDVFNLQKESQGFPFVGVTESRKFYTIDGGNCEELTIEKAAQTLRKTTSEFLEEVDKVLKVKLTEEQLDTPLEEVKEEQPEVEKEVEEQPEVKEVEKVEEARESKIDELMKSTQEVKQPTITKEEVIEQANKLLELVKKLA